MPNAMADPDSKANDGKDEPHDHHHRRRRNSREDDKVVDRRNHPTEKEEKDRRNNNNNNNNNSKERRRGRHRRCDDSKDDTCDNHETSIESKSRDDRRKEERRRDRPKRKKRSSSDSDDSDDSSDQRKRRRQRRRRRHRRKETSRRKKSSSSKQRSKRKKRQKHESSSSSSSSDSSDSSSDSSSTSSSSSSDEKSATARTKVLNHKLLAKLNARGETLEERKERRNQKRAAKIAARFGYTAENNPFNDPNLQETFSWGKKKQKLSAAAAAAGGGDDLAQNKDTLEEIETIRRRREERERERDEMDRLRAEEARMKELEHYDDWAKKEEEFHLQQQRQRSAIRLVEGREKPVDVLAKNLLLFGLSDEDKKNRAAVKYQERYSALDELQTLEAELDEPYKLLALLKLEELQELLLDIDAFRRLEREAMSGNPNESIIQYWDALHLVARDEIKLIENGGSDSSYARKIKDIRSIFEGQSLSDLHKMKEEVESKLRKSARGASYGSDGGVIDRDYWSSVLEQLTIHLAKVGLSELHSKMLVRQLEKLEQKKEELTKNQSAEKSNREQSNENETVDDQANSMVPNNVTPDFGNLEEELGLTNEVNLGRGTNAYSWQDRYRPRKPRYFNRVKTGYDWNKYNQTHYDHDNPPPKIVQGYKFNIFYPDLVDPTKTPQYFLEPADTNDFCVLRFHAGPPYEDVAFKIINREWNRSRKRGFRSTFERGVLSLYFNFTSHWYRR